MRTSFAARAVELEHTGTLADRHALFQAERSHLTDELRATSHHLVSNAVQGLDLDLSSGLDLDKAHGWAGHRLGDRGCVEVSFLFDFT
jgi:hypothetical protein